VLALRIGYAGTPSAPSPPRRRAETRMSCQPSDAPWAVVLSPRDRAVPGSALARIR
jgi:hypothetical protein